MARRKGLQKLAGKLLHFGLHQVVGEHDPHYTVSLTLEAKDGSEQKTEVVLDLADAEWLCESLGHYVETARSHNALLEAARKATAEREVA